MEEKRPTHLELIAIGVIAAIAGFVLFGYLLVSEPPDHRLLRGIYGGCGAFCMWFGWRLMSSIDRPA
jgi:hypothetical protein